MLNPFQLAGLAMGPEAAAAIYSEARGRKADFPANCCALVASLYLRLMEAKIGICLATEDLAEELARYEGWKRIQHGPGVVPRPGDLYFCADANGNGKPDHCGIVIAPVTEALFWQRDNRADRRGGLYQRQSGPGGYTPVWFWMRAPEAALAAGQGATMDLEEELERR